MVAVGARQGTARGRDIDDGAALPLDEDAVVPAGIDRVRCEGEPVQCPGLVRDADVIGEAPGYGAVRNSGGPGKPVGGTPGFARGRPERDATLEVGCVVAVGTRDIATVHREVVHREAPDRVVLEIVELHPGEGDIAGSVQVDAAAVSGGVPVRAPPILDRTPRTRRGPVAGHGEASSGLGGVVPHDAALVVVARDAPEGEVAVRVDQVERDAVAGGHGALVGDGDQLDTDAADGDTRGRIPVQGQYCNAAGQGQGPRQRGLGPGARERGAVCGRREAEGRRVQGVPLADEPLAELEAQIAGIAACAGVDEYPVAHVSSARRDKGRHGREGVREPAVAGGGARRGVVDEPDPVGNGDADRPHAATGDVGERVGEGVRPVVPGGRFVCEGAVCSHRNRSPVHAGGVEGRDGPCGVLSEVIVRKDARASRDTDGKVSRARVSIVNRNGRDLKGPGDEGEVRVQRVGEHHARGVGSRVGDPNGVVQRVPEVGRKLVHAFRCGHRGNGGLRPGALGPGCHSREACTRSSA